MSCYITSLYSQAKTIHIVLSLSMSEIIIFGYYDVYCDFPFFPSILVIIKFLINSFITKLTPKGIISPLLWQEIIKPKAQSYFLSVYFYCLRNGATLEYTRFKLVLLRWKVEYSLTAHCFLFMHLTICLQLFFSPSLHTWYSVPEKHLKIVLLSSFINMSEDANARTKQALCMVQWKL